MKKYLIFIFLLSGPLVLAQGNNQHVKEQAEATAKALIEDDYETLLKFTYPKVIELVGGRDQMISLIKKGKIEMKEQGITFEQVTIGEPTPIVTAGNEIHCLIPQTILMKVPNGKVRSESHLLAVSQNSGEHWFFIDTVKLNKDNIKMVVPNFNEALQLPDKKEPQFIAD
ncbi:MAG TPA: hypothetical protein VGK59_20525 [Ohtaekwangia sp.]